MLIRNRYLFEDIMKICVLILLIGIMSTGFTQDTSGVRNQILDDVVIKETYEVGTEEEKMPIRLRSNFTNLVEIRERINWSSVPWSNEDLSKFQLFECGISSPELVEINPEPAKVFHVNFENLAHWKLDILSSDGIVFFTLNGENDPPESIAWDGRGNSGDPLIPGEQYAYSFTATDKAGNRRSFPGEAFSVPALCLTTVEGAWVGLSNTLLFSSNGYGLSSTAENYSNELANLIYYYSTNGTIKIESQHPDTQKFLELLAQKVGLDVSYFEVLNDPKPQKNCFMMWLN